MTDPIDRIRVFNRRYTSRMGLLSRNYLSSDLTMTEARVLYELCEAGPAQAGDLARRLDVDEGYLSRIVDAFAERGWVRKDIPPDDARRRIITVQSDGRRVFEPLQERSRADIARRIGKADPEIVARRIDALEVALDGIDPERVLLRDLDIGDAGWLIQRHAELYATHEGFDASFEALVARILADYIETRDPALERAWIAEHAGERLGSVFCVQSGEAGVAKLRLFLLEPEARGLGLGQRLLDACLTFARERGYRRMRLWTHESHRAACALYAKNGFCCVESKPVRSFGQDLVEQTWEIALA